MLNSISVLKILIDETTLKSAISMRWSLPLNILTNDMEGQDYAIQNRT